MRAFNEHDPPPPPPPPPFPIHNRGIWKNIKEHRLIAAGHQGEVKSYTPRIIRSAVCVIIAHYYREFDHAITLYLSLFCRDSFQESLGFVNTFARRNFRRAAFQTGCAPIGVTPTRATIAEFNQDPDG